MQLDFRNYNWVMSSPSPRTKGGKKAFSIDAKPANLPELIFAELPDLLETKDELKGLGNIKCEVHSPNVYMEKGKYNPLVFLDHKLETKSIMSSTDVGLGKEKRNRFWLNLKAHWMNSKAGLLM